MKITKKFLVFTSLLLIFTLVFTGCSKKVTETDGNEGTAQIEDNQDNVDQGKKELSGIINVVGSTSVTPIAELLAEKFANKNEKVEINVQGVGSTAGIKSAIDGTAEIGMSSRDLKQEEKDTGVKEYLIAYDGIVVAVHPSNPISDLDMGTITKIFKGEIKNWKEVGGKDEEILVVSREDGSGTRGAFEELLELEENDASGNKVSALKKDALIADGNGAVKANVSKKENAIGYISLSYLDDSVKGLTVEGVVATVENIQSKEYKISRAFYMLTNGEESDVVKEFLNFILSPEGQEVVAEKQIPISK